MIGACRRKNNAGTTSPTGSTDQSEATLSHSHSLGLTGSNAGRARPGLRSMLALALAVAALIVAVVILVSGPTTPLDASAAHYTYGGLPSWLPSSVPPTNQILDASPQHPQLAIEGDVVKVALSSGTSTVVLTGPQTPPFVAPPPPYTTATLTIALKDSSGRVPLRARDFAFIDGNGTVFRPSDFVGGAASVVVPVRSPVTVRLREFMAVGSGSIRWAPAGHPVVTWEFTVEND